TERCVIQLRPEGLTVTEIAPGIDLERDVLGHAGIPLRVSDDLRTMDPRLFHPEPMRLTLMQKGRGYASASNTRSCSVHGCPVLSISTAAGKKRTARLPKERRSKHRAG